MYKIRVFFVKQKNKAVIYNKDYFLDKMPLEDLKLIRDKLEDIFSGKTLALVNKRTDLEIMKNENILKDVQKDTIKLQKSIMDREKDIDSVSYVIHKFTNQIGFLLTSQNYEKKKQQLVTKYEKV